MVSSTDFASGVLRRASQETSLPLRGTKCTVIITHYNYAHLVNEALLSVRDQTHGDFECIIVDDASDAASLSMLRDAIAALADTRFRILELSENKGQTPAIFAGLSDSDGPFVALLDPDDVYDSAFLETMLRAHLNPRLVASVAACEMGIFQSNGGILGKETTGFRRRAEPEQRAQDLLSFSNYSYHRHYPAWQAGWHWASTSGMMFRRDALEQIRPFEFPPEVKFNGDSYCGHGAHMLGGTVFVDMVLSWRRIHSSNTARVSRHVSSTQIRLRKDFVDFTAPLKLLAIDTFFRRGGGRHFDVAALGEVLKAHFTAEQLADLAATNNAVSDVLIRFAANADWSSDSPASVSSP